jgi:uroporphyrinogen-III synthase
MGLEPTGLPLFRAEAVSWRMPDSGAYDIILLTSANTVRLAGEQLRALTHLPAYCVGPATAQAARAAGFSDVMTGTGGLEALLTGKARQLSGKRILHLGGKHRVAFDWKEIRITHCCVYDVIAIYPELPTLLGRTSAVAMIHSPRAAAHFSALLENHTAAKPSVSLICISDAAAQSAGHGWQGVAVAAEPREDAMLAALSHFVQAGGFYT